MILLYSIVKTILDESFCPGEMKAGGPCWLYLIKAKLPNSFIYPLTQLTFMKSVLSIENTEMNTILTSWGFHLIEEDPAIKIYVHAVTCAYRDTEMPQRMPQRIIKQSRGIGSKGGRGCS